MAERPAAHRRRSRHAARSSRPTGRRLPSPPNTTGTSTFTRFPSPAARRLRLTWHPAPDIARGFTPDGKAVLFASPRHVFTHRYMQLFTVPLGGGMPTQLPIPHAAEACFSPDGQQIAYTPLADRSAQWKHYRGGTHRASGSSTATTIASRKSPSRRPAATISTRTGSARCVYFRSDRNGEFNLFAYDTKSKTVKQLTRHADFPVVERRLGRRPADLRAGRLPAPVRPGRGDRHAAEDRRGDGSGRGAATLFVKGAAKYIRDAGISPSGAGPCSSTAARSSPCRPRRAIRAT